MRLIRIEQDIKFHAKELFSVKFYLLTYLKMVYVLHKEKKNNLLNILSFHKKPDSLQNKQKLLAKTNMRLLFLESQKHICLRIRDQKELSER